MPTVALKAHYDGERIVLDEPFDFLPNTPLMITVLPDADTERAAWEALAVESLSRAYGSNEPEYTLDDIKHGA